MPPADAARAQPGGDLATLDRAIAALEAQRSVLGDEVVETALAPLRERREQLASTQVGEQRRLVTVLFADLVDFTGLSGRLDAEDTREVVDACFARWHAAIEAQDGVVEKFIGDAVMAVFGLRTSWEDDAERAARAGLAMTAATAELSRDVQQRFGVEVHVRVGLDTGDVVVSTFGERPGHEFVAVGPTVNRASRIQSAAPPDRVLVSSDTYRQIRSGFNVEAVPPLRLKGIDAPVDAYLVVSERPRGFRVDRTGAVGGVEAATVGRSRELSLLQDRFRQVIEERRWQRVTVVGDAGIGKSRVLNDFDLWLAGSAQRVWWFHGRASPATQSQAGALTRDVVATRMEIQESDSHAIVRHKLESGFARAFGPGEEARRAAYLVGVWLGFDLGPDPLPSVPAEPQSVRDQAIMALGRYFARLAEQHPVVILLEDLHWADAASVRLLEQAEVLWSDLPMLVVASTRPSFLERHPEWAEGAPAEAQVTLGALSSGDSRTLVTDLLRRVEYLPDPLVEVVVGSGEGNPFYLEELVTWLLDSGVVVPDEPHWRVVPAMLGTLAVPPSLKGLLQARVDGLTAAERVLLQRASVVGRVFWDDAVQALEPRPDLAAGDTLDRLRGRDLVFERDLSAFESAREYLFKHALLRDVVYDSVLRARRREYHRRAGAWLAEVSARSGRAEEYAALIAEHYDRAHDPAAVEWFLRAGRRAARVFAIDEATDLLNRAEQLAPADRPELRFDIIAAREDVFERSGDRVRQQADLDRMTALSRTFDDPGRTVTVLLANSRRAFEHSEYEDAAALGTRATEVARRAGLEERVAEAHLAVGKALTWNEKSSAATRELRTALTLARAADQTAVAAESLRYLAMVASNDGRFAEALEVGVQAIAEFAKEGNVEAEGTAVAQHAVTLYNVGRVHEAREAFASVLEVFRSSGHAYRQAIALGNLASCALAEGDLSEAAAWSREAVAFTDQLEDLDSGAMNWIIQGLVLLWTGRWPQARILFEDALDTSREIESSMLEADASLWLVVGRLEHPGHDDHSDLVAVARDNLDRAENLSPAVRARAQLALAYALLTDKAVEGDDAEVTLDETLDLFDDVISTMAQTVPGLAFEAAVGRVAVALRRGDAGASAAAGPLVELLDQLPDGEPARRGEVLMVSLRPPTVLSTLAQATVSDTEHAALVRAAATAFLQRRVNGSKDATAAAGFLGLESVQALMRRLALRAADLRG